MALSKKYRLAGSDFKRVFEKGKTVRGSFFFIRFLNNGVNHLRLAVAVASKVSKKAVVRNRLRRILTEAIKVNNLYKAAIDVVIVVAKNSAGKSPEEINDEIKKIMAEIFVKR